MITEFENTTNYLTDLEKKLAEKIALVLEATPNSHIKYPSKIWRESLHRAYNIEVSEVRFRKIIQYLRLTGRIKGICSSEEGYWIAKDPEDLKKTLISLRDRLVMQKATYDALLKQYKEMLDEEAPFE